MGNTVRRTRLRWAAALALILVAAVTGLGSCYPTTDDSRVLASLPAETPPVLPATLSVLVWNVYKGQRDGWQGDLRRLAGAADLVLLQEVVTTDEMLAGLQALAGVRWDYAASFDYDGGRYTTGVMIGARAPAAAVDYLRSPEREPVVGTPKMTLIGRYPMAGGEAALLVVNVHGHLAVTASAFSRQMKAVAGRIAGHAGPILWAGDFNTWSDTRSAAVETLTVALGLSPVTISPEGRTSIFGHVIDRAFVRGLEVIASQAYPEVESSDHVPFTFRLRRRLPQPPVTSR